MKILICGGGTAGWLAALMIAKAQRHSHNITVVESSKIGIIGAGEGSTGYLTDIILGTNYDYGCNERDFLVETNATVKLGIHHKSWQDVGVDYIAPIDTSAAQSLIDYTVLHAIANDFPVHLSSIDGFLIEKSKSSFMMLEENKLENIRSHAYHFDAHLVGKYFKKVCGDSVNTIDSEIIDITLTEDGSVKEIKLANGQTIEADFFIDCTGFKKLFAKKLNVNWISYSKNLPVNRAMPFLLDYEDNEEIKPVTTAWAQSAGWMWQIPTQTRKGCGYVYCSDFISDDDAHAEIEKLLGRSVDPIKVLNFDTGRQEKLWHKNCLFLGLCAAFAEPLEATSIHSTIVQLQSFIFSYLKDTKQETCNDGSINVYNKRMSRMYDDFKDFLNLHYMTNRKDSKFWLWMQTRETITETSANILEMQKYRTLQASDIDNYHGYAGASLYNWILAGLGYLNKEIAVKELAFFGDTDKAALIWKLHQDRFFQIADTMIDNTDFIKNLNKYLHGTVLHKHTNCSSW